MATLKLHYDGWLVLPAGLRRALELESGDRLEAELVDGAIVLRPAKGSGQPPSLRRWLSCLLPSRLYPLACGPYGGQAAPWPAEEGAGGPSASRAAAGPGRGSPAPPKRKPGRPRKVATAELAAIAEPPQTRSSTPRPTNQQVLVQLLHQLPLGEPRPNLPASDRITPPMAQASPFPQPVKAAKREH